MMNNTEKIYKLLISNKKEDVRLGYELSKNVKDFSLKDFVEHYAKSNKDKEVLTFENINYYNTIRRGLQDEIINIYRSDKSHDYHNNKLKDLPILIREIHYDKDILHVIYAIHANEEIIGYYYLFYKRVNLDFQCVGVKLFNCTEFDKVSKYLKELMDLKIVENCKEYDKCLPLIEYSNFLESINETLKGTDVIDALLNLNE